MIARAECQRVVSNQTDDNLPEMLATELGVAAYRHKRQVTVSVKDFSIAERHCALKLLEHKGYKVEVKKTVVPDANYKPPQHERWVIKW